MSRGPLAARWVRNFLALSLPPALIVFFFSAWFLTSTIDSWFDVRVEAALEDSLQLGQQFLDTRTLEVRNQLRETAWRTCPAAGRWRDAAPGPAGPRAGRRPH